MIYDMRIYTAHPGKEEALIRRFTEKVIPIMASNGIEVVSAFRSAEEPSKLVYVTRFADAARREAAWKAFGADAQWAQVKAASEVDGPLLAAQNATVMTDLLG